MEEDTYRFDLLGVQPREVCFLTLTLMLQYRDATLLVLCTIDVLFLAKLREAR